MSSTSLRRSTIAALWLGAAALAACTAPTLRDAPQAADPPASVEVRQALAPTGSLRIAVYPGSPTSLIRRPGSDVVCGVTVEVGREAARRLGVPPRLVEVERVEQVIEALHSGQADLTITNASPARKAILDFTPTLLLLESGYLVMPGSPVTSLADADRPGVRVGVAQGGTSHATLARTLHQASVVPVPSLKVASELLQKRELDAFASNKGILFQLADGLPGARVLEGRWGAEALAIAVPQGRDVGRAWLERFNASVQRQGLVQRAAECAGLRGLAQPEGTT